jgi:hypothetical protein
VVERDRVVATIEVAAAGMDARLGGSYRVVCEHAGGWRCGTRGPAPAR